MSSGGAQLLRRTFSSQACGFRSCRPRIPVRRRAVVPGHVERPHRAESNRSGATLGIGLVAYFGCFVNVDLARLIESPSRVSRWALWTSRSRIASASVGSPIVACQALGAS